ncbi:MAG: 50S ribosomal protein L11 methyltransferase, partial [Gemmatimonadota bacterium]
YTLDPWPLQLVDTADPRKFMMRGGGWKVMALTSLSWLLPVELDPEAIADAEANVAANGVGDRVTVLEADAVVALPLIAPVRVIIANIISSVLVELLPAMRDALAADGEAILSGILHDERAGLLDVLAAKGWRVTAEDTERPWWSCRIARA